MTIEEHARELEYCSYCPKLCRHACPVSNALGSETVTPQGKMHALNMLRRNAIPWQQDYSWALYACTGCGLCQQYCDHDNDVAATLWDGRSEAVSRGLTPAPLRDLPRRFRARSERLRATLAATIPADRRAKEGRVGYFPGCDAIETSPQDILDTLAVFERLDLSFIRVVDAPLACAGYPLWAAGQDEALRFAAEELIKAVRPFATLVVGCPACVHLLRNVLPSHGIQHNTEVLHTVELLGRHAERLPIRRTRPEAYYHDPCYLGRHLGVFEAPRRLLARCVDATREFFHSRDKSECCGGGGLAPLLLPEVTRAQARRRLEEPALLDTSLLVTSCPSCVRTFRAAERAITTVDLVSLIAWATAETDPATDGGP